MPSDLPQHGQSSNDLVVTLLITRFKPCDLTVAQGQVFGFSTSHSLAPQREAGTLHGLAHQLNHFCFRYAELDRDGIESGAIFPRHLDYTVDFFNGKRGDIFI